MGSELPAPITLSRRGSGPAVLCHPGGPGFAGDHLQNLGGLDRFAELLLVNPRGTGDTPPAPDGNYGLDAYVADLEALRAHLDLPQIAVFGHSHGGFVAAKYAARHPERVTALILDAMPLRVADVEFPADGVHGYFHQWDPVGAEYTAQYLSSPWEAAGRYFAEHEATGLDMTDDLRKVRAPCLVIAGEDDFATGAGVLAECVELLPDGRSAVIPAAGHFAWVDAPGEYAAAVSSFLRSRG